MPYLDVDNQKLFYLTNEINASASPPIVFIHGAGGNHRHWLYQWRALAKLGLKVFTLDLPGHGSSLGELPANLDEYARILNNFCLQLNLTAPVLVGHSMGGAVSLLAALIAPLSYKGLFLVSTGISFPMAGKLLEFIRENKYGEFLESLYGQFSTPLLKKKAFEELNNVPREVFINDFKACSQVKISPKLVNRLKIPITIMIGTEDQVTPPYLSLELFQLLPNSNLLFISQGNHMLMLQQPELVTAKLLEFIGENE